MCLIHYHDALIFVGHILLHQAVGDLTPAHLLLQLTDSLCPSLHLLAQLWKKSDQRLSKSVSKKEWKNTNKKQNSVCKDYN